MGKLAIWRERESYFQRKIIPQRENFPFEGKFAQFSLGGKILPQKMFRVVALTLSNFLHLHAGTRPEFKCLKV